MHAERSEIVSQNTLEKDKNSTLKFLIMLENVQKCQEMLENALKCQKMIENVRKMLENILKWQKQLENVRRKF